MDLDDGWEEKRRQQSEAVAAVAEKAKQRKEEEEKRFEETRSKSESEKRKKDKGDIDVDDVKKEQGDNFRQLTQLDSRNYSRGGENQQYMNRVVPPRFQRQQHNMRQQQQNSPDSRWGNQHYLGNKQRLRGESDEGKEKDDDSNRRDRNTPEPSERLVN